MLEVEVVGLERLPAGPGEQEIARLCRLAAHSLGVEDGHVAVELVDGARIAELNSRHRARSGPTDVLSFPIDGVGAGPTAGGPPRELGDIVISPAHTTDLAEAVLHGMLHLLGMDHESDQGEMLALQDELMAQAQR